MQPPRSSRGSRSPSRIEKTSTTQHPTKEAAGTLPSRNVNSATIADAYVAFILYCNPNIPEDADTSALKTNFQNPPKSDNKEFDMFRLFELIQLHDAGEIKTWSQLALDLGVEPPDAAKGQSVQKVQQYSVRLKRWMRSMHIDAFFEYLMGKNHSYFNDIPPANDPYAKDGRDGVLPEDDLAIRALDPSLRPKRGRRRNSAIELEEIESDNDNKRARLADGSTTAHVPSSAYPHSSVPMSGYPSGFNNPWAVASAVTPQSLAPWGSRAHEPQSSISTTAPSRYRWHNHGEPNTAITLHPANNQLSSFETADGSPDDEPRSAITPAVRRRRKYGHAVSSAWPSMNGSGAKPRGRPPASRNVHDGSFGMFPANPSGNKTPETTAPRALSVERRQSTDFNEASETPVHPRPSESHGRPNRLSLQVPQYTGAPVRLATPPIIISGEGEDQPRLQASPPRIIEAPPLPENPQPRRRIHTVGDVNIIEREVPGFAFEVLKRALASDLLRAEIVGRRKRLSGEEAKRLSDSILTRFNIPRADTDNSRDDITRLTAASWLGLGEQLRVPLGPATGRNKKLTVTRFRIDAEGYEEIVGSDDESITDSQLREVFDFSWNANMGGCDGSFELKGLTLGAPSQQYEDSHDFVIRTWTDSVRAAGMSDEWAAKVVARAEKGDLDNPYVEQAAAAKAKAPDDMVDWRAKYMEALFGANMARGEFHRIRDILIEKVLDVLM